MDGTSELLGSTEINSMVFANAFVDDYAEKAPHHCH